MADKITELIVEALRQSLAEPAEQRLFRSGKLTGLFPSRTGPGGDAAAKALSEGLLEVARTEAKGKIATEWVHTTPKGVNFLRERESPQKALEQIGEILRANRDQLPVWLAQMQEELRAVGFRLTQAAEGWTHRLEALSLRVEEACAARRQVNRVPSTGLPATSNPG